MEGGLILASTLPGSNPIHPSSSRASRPALSRLALSRTPSARDEVDIHEHVGDGVPAQPELNGVYLLGHTTLLQGRVGPIDKLHGFPFHLLDSVCWKC